ncbi:MAG: GIY-YIG nuclease family protein [Nitrospira sp.]
MFSKAHILAEIKRTAQDNGGLPLGTARFRTETGIKSSDWMGKFWARWGDALTEAGFKPNLLQGPRKEDELLEILASFTRELGHFPVANEIKLRARTEPEFPWHNTFARLGDKRVLLGRLRDFCLARGEDDVATLCTTEISKLARREPSTEGDFKVDLESDLGYVYLLKSSRYYKIGRSNAVGRRERELAIQLPEKSKVVHSIKTDDPIGIEAYWHNRFKDHRKNGEWFELDATDVSAFKRRKFM